MPAPFHSITIFTKAARLTHENEEEEEEGPPMTSKIIGYWVATGLFSVALAASGLAHLTKVEAVVASMTAMGYPLYFMTIIGMWKLAGAIVLLIPGQAVLKEWAYAGFLIHLSGAALSHAFAGDPVGTWVPPVVLLGVAACSYLLRPADRRLPGVPSWSEDPMSATPT